MRTHTFRMGGTDGGGDSTQNTVSHTGGHVTVQVADTDPTCAHCGYTGPVTSTVIGGICPDCGNRPQGAAASAGGR